MVFAVSAVAILGVVGLATEVGSWYLAREQAYNTADAAAIAGALAAMNSARTGAAGEIATLNGFPSVDVVPHSPPSQGNYTDNDDATEVLVSVNFSPLLASLFGVGPVTVTARAVGLVQSTQNYVCALSLLGGMTINQNQNGYGAFPCYYGSNVADTSAVILAAEATIAAAGITTPGDCNCPTLNTPALGGSDASGNWLGRPYSSYQPPTLNPYAPPSTNPSLSSTVSSVLSAATIICPQSGISYPANTQFYPPNGNYANCPTTVNTPATVSTSYLVPTVGDAYVGGRSNVSPTCLPTGAQVCGYYNMNVTIASQTLTLSPPMQHSPTSAEDTTYLFVNASLDVQSTATLQCMVNWVLLSGQPVTQFCGHPTHSPDGTVGVTFVFIGSAVGNLTIESGANVNLAAPATNDFSSALSGILFYRAGSAPAESALSPGVSIADYDNANVNLGVNLSGGMYFPESYVSYTGNTNASTDPTTGLTATPTCSIIVAGYLNLGSSAAEANPTQFSPQCVSYNLAVPMVQAAQVVE